MQELKSSIFSTKKGLKIVNSPTKLKILNLLMENGEMYFNEIVNAVGKSKSTISTHLKDLINEGIVKSKVSPRNRRKKIFYVESKYLGKIMQRSPYKFHENIEDLKKLLKDGSRGFYRLMFHLIRVELMKKGIDLDPILKNVGKKLGKIIYDEVEEKNFEKLLIKLVNFWQKYGLGKMEIKKKKPLEIKVYDCFECGTLPNIGKSACVLDSGILSNIFQLYTGKKVKVNEKKCYAQGNDFCLFELSFEE